MSNWWCYCCVMMLLKEGFTVCFPNFYCMFLWGIFLLYPVILLALVFQFCRLVFEIYAGGYSVFFGGDVQVTCMRSLPLAHSLSRPSMCTHGNLAVQGNLSRHEVLVRTLKYNPAGAVDYKCLCTLAQINMVLPCCSNILMFSSSKIQNSSISSKANNV